MNLFLRLKVVHDNKVLVDGFINDFYKTLPKCGNLLFSQNEKHLNQNDIYTIFSMRGFCYG